jgi:hypothetical protein
MAHKFYAVNKLQVESLHQLYIKLLMGTGGEEDTGRLSCDTNQHNGDRK